MIPVYITHDGQAFTARYSRKRGIYGAREYRSSSLVESLRTYAQPIIGAVYASQPLSEAKTPYLFDEELGSWCIESFGVPFKTLTTDAEAAHSIVKTAVSTPERYQIIYLLEGRVKFLLIEKESITSVIHMAQEELTTAGIEKMIERSHAWYRESFGGAKPEQLFILGQLTETAADAVHLLESDNICSVIAAGTGLIKSPSILLKAPLSHGILRTIRGGLLAISIALMSAAALFYVNDRAQSQKILANIENSPYQLELTAEQIQARDSLSQLSVKHISTFRHLSNQRRWSDILENFSAVSHDGVILGRFGSREANGVLSLAFDGEGASEKAVTGYVQKLKESDSFEAVQLMEIDRNSNGKYRFRIQCNVQ